MPSTASRAADLLELALLNLTEPDAWQREHPIAGVTNAARCLRGRA